MKAIMAGKTSTVGVAIVGCGTVGGGVAKMLTGSRDLLRGRIAPRLELRHIVDLDFRHARKMSLDKRLFTRDLQDALGDEQVSVVVELIGGTTIARKVIEQALRAGKHVVTANKALLAHAGPELLALARSLNLTVSFEASCGGGIPIIRALYDGLIANRIDAMYGIVNGTCNYILTSMTDHGKTYSAALAEAQRAGLAEADPTLDVAGIDSAHKLTILAGLAFGARIDFDEIFVEGIDQLDIHDIVYGQELGYTVKLLAIAQRQSDGLSLRVRPAFISRQHPLAWVSGPFNAISVYGHATGHTMYYGRGAGATPTASAVVADIAAVATGAASVHMNQLKIWPDQCEPTRQLPIQAVQSRYYLRLIVDDRPGVFGKLASVLGSHQISISSVLQHEAPSGLKDTAVPVIITTHHAVEGNLRSALDELDALHITKAKSVCIGIVDEHAEQV
jgi:homoserine dehydrogenase